EHLERLLDLLVVRHERADVLDLALEHRVLPRLLLELLDLRLVEEEERDDLEDHDAERDEQPALARLGRGPAGAAPPRQQVDADHERFSRSLRIASPSETQHCAARSRSSSWFTSLACTVMRSIGWISSTATRARRPIAAGSAGRFDDPPVR